MNFSISEEAFILRSLKEVVNVWARGSGQATFSLTVEDGMADLKLGFQLGLPTDVHLPNQVPPPSLRTNFTPEARHYQGRKKTPSRRRRDLARAAQHRAVAGMPEEAETAAQVNKVEAVMAPAIVLLYRKLLPVH